MKIDTVHPRLQDYSGNAFHGKLVNSPVLTGSEVRLDNKRRQYIKAPAGLLAAKLQASSSFSAFGWVFLASVSLESLLEPLCFTGSNVRMIPPGC